MSRALIVIDPQPSGLDDSAIMVHINRLLAINWDVVVLTSDGNRPFHRDLHGCAVTEAETAVFQAEADASYDEAWADRDPDSTCSGGAVTAAMLARAAKEIRIYKDRRHDGVGMPCFSAFEGVGVDDAPLVEQLKTRDITEVWICGLCHEIGIQSTAQDAVALGFRTKVVYAATRVYIGAAEMFATKGVEQGVVV